MTFDAVVTADDAGAYKPALNHFQLALAQLAEMGVPKDRVLHVAQSLYHDHVPAKRLGLSTMWVNRRAARPRPAWRRHAGRPGAGHAGRRGPDPGRAGRPAPQRAAG